MSEDTIGAKGPNPAALPDVAQTDHLPRTLGVFALGFIFVAFCAPLAVLAGYLQPAIAFGNGIGAPVAFLAAGGLFLLFEVGFLAMSRHMKSPGAFYCYIAEGIGKPGALAGALLATVAYIALAVTGYVYFGLIVQNLMNQLFGSTVLPWQLWGLVCVLIVTVLNLLRVDFSAKAVAVGVALEIIIVGIYQAVVMTKGGPEGYAPKSFAPAEFLAGNPGLAVLFALLTMTGLEAMAVFREEVRNPEKTVPRAAYGAIVFTTLFFALAAWAYIVAVGPSKVVDEARTAPVDSFFATVQTYLGSFFPTLVAVLLVTSQLAAANSVQGASVRYMYTLGHDHVLPKRLGRVHPKLGSPHIAVIASVAVCLVAYLAVIAASNDVVLIYGAVGAYGAICFIPLLLGTCASVIVYFRKTRGVENSWRTTIAPSLAFVGLTAVLVFALSHLDLMFGNKLIGVICAFSLLLIIAVGILVALRIKQIRPEIYRRIGRQVDDIHETHT